MSMEKSTVLTCFRAGKGLDDLHEQARDVTWDKMRRRSVRFPQSV
jgi:hypothetical protein